MIFGLFGNYECANENDEKSFAFYAVLVKRQRIYKLNAELHKM
jgi:hypothetical protein